MIARARQALAEAIATSSEEEEEPVQEKEEEIPLGAPPPPARPFEGAAGSKVGETCATVCWGLLPGAPVPDEFEVECRQQGKSDWGTACIAECTIEKDENLSPSLWVVQLDELEPRQEYLVRVRAKNDAGWGKWSDISAGIRTLEPAELQTPAVPNGKKGRTP